MDLLTPPAQDDVIYAITDGGDTSSKVKVSQIEKLLAARHVRLFSLIPLSNTLRGGPRGADFFREPLLNMNRLTETTGGNQLYLFPVSEYSDVYWRNENDQSAILIKAKRLYEQMRQSYRLGIQLALPTDKPRKWDLRVVDNRGKKLHNLRVLYPQKIMPCQN